jgi:RNA polymerase-binding transcription factor DksA
MNKTIFAELRDALTVRRAELLDQRRGLKQSREDLTEPESELVASASKTAMTAEIDQRTEKVRTAIMNIDIALTRMAAGDYGRCQACRRPIRVKRLQALPWTNLCVKCAGRHEAFHTANRDGGPGDESDDAAEHDDDIREAVREELREDGRVDTGELVISSEDGVVYLEGYLPNDAQRQRLIEIVHEAADVADVVDSIIVDRQPWQQRSEHAHGDATEGKSAEALAGEETDTEVEAYTAFETGEPMTPPDQLISENQLP